MKYFKIIFFTTFLVFFGFNIYQYFFKTISTYSSSEIIELIGHDNQEELNQLIQNDINISFETVLFENRNTITDQNNFYIPISLFSEIGLTVDNLELIDIFIKVISLTHINSNLNSNDNSIVVGIENYSIYNENRVRYYITPFLILFGEKTKFVNYENNTVKTLSVKDYKLFSDLIKENSVKLANPDLQPILLEQLRYFQKSVEDRLYFFFELAKKSYYSKSVNQTLTALNLMYQNSKQLSNNPFFKQFFKQYTPADIYRTMTNLIYHKEKASQAIAISKQYQLDHTVKIKGSNEGICLADVPQDISIDFSKVGHIKITHSHYTTIPYDC